MHNDQKPKVENKYITKSNLFCAFLTLKLIIQKKTQKTKIFLN